MTIFESFIEFHPVKSPPGQNTSNSPRVQGSKNIVQFAPNILLI